MTEFVLKKDSDFKELNQYINTLDVADCEYHIEIKKKAKGITQSQRNAMHLWCGQVAKYLNDSGQDMRLVLSHHPEISWSKESVKEKLYRPIYTALTSKTSTEESKKVEYSDAAVELTRHFGSKGLVLPPWPSKDNKF